MKNSNYFKDRKRIAIEVSKITYKVKNFMKWILRKLVKKRENIHFGDEKNVIPHCALTLQIYIDKIIVFPVN